MIVPAQLLVRHLVVASCIHPAGSTLPQLLLAAGQTLRSTLALGSYWAPSSGTPVLFDGSSPMNEDEDLAVDVEVMKTLHRQCISNLEALGVDAWERVYQQIRESHAPIPPTHRSLHHSHLLFKTCEGHQHQHPTPGIGLTLVNANEGSHGREQRRLRPRPDASHPSEFPSAIPTTAPPAADSNLLSHVPHL